MTEYEVAEVQLAVVEVQLAVVEMTKAALAMPLTAREQWFVHVALAMHKANLLLGWDGNTAQTVH